MAQTHVNHGLPSPATSARSPASTVGDQSTGLPNPRSQPLKPGSSKEAALINYIDDKILRITRRYAKKFSNSESDGDSVPGYTDFDQFLVDIEPIFDIVWISGTPSLQIPYLLSLAGFFCTYMRAFTLTQAMFRIAGKFDLGFSSLLKPDGSLAYISHKVSVTEKVRIKSLVEETRLNAVRVASDTGVEAHLEDSSSSESSDEQNEDEGERIILANGYRTSKQKIAKNISRIYELTIESLGDTLGSISMPVMTDDAACVAAFEEKQDEVINDDEVIEL